MKTMKLAVAVLAFTVSGAALAQRGLGAGVGLGAGAGLGGNGVGLGAGVDASTNGALRGVAGDALHGTVAANASGNDANLVLTHNTHLSANLERILPQGTTAQQACAGFRNLGECVTAAHVSNNLNIPFADLKSRLTGSGAVSLGKAIQSFDANVNAKAETKRAQAQAQADLAARS